MHELVDKNSPPSSTSRKFLTLLSEYFAISRFSRSSVEADLRMDSYSRTASSRTYLKLGRTIHPILRLSQWRSSCPSLDPIVRDILPRSLPSSSPNRKRFADTGTENCHRWERLCLVEVAGRLELEQGAEKESREKCRDCGKKHLECFWVGRDAFGEMGARDGGGGWVVEVVERWERWCRDVLG